MDQDDQDEEMQDEDEQWENDEWTEEEWREYKAQTKEQEDSKGSSSKDFSYLLSIFTLSPATIIFHFSKQKSFILNSSLNIQLYNFGFQF